MSYSFAEVRYLGLGGAKYRKQNWRWHHKTMKSALPKSELYFDSYLCL